MSHATPDSDVVPSLVGEADGCEDAHLRWIEKLVWTDGFECRRLSVGSALLAVAMTPNRRLNSLDWTWRVFTRPDVTGVGEIIGTETTREGAEAVAEATAIEHWHKNPDVRNTLLPKENPWTGQDT